MTRPYGLHFILRLRW